MKRTSGIRHRWLINNVSIMVLLVIAAVAAVALAVSVMVSLRALRTAQL